MVIITRHNINMIAMSRVVQPVFMLNVASQNGRGVTR